MFLLSELKLEEGRRAGRGQQCRVEGSDELACLGARLEAPRSAHGTAVVMSWSNSFSVLVERFAVVKRQASAQRALVY